MARFRKVSSFPKEYHEGRHRFEHWYRDNQVYFLTARCRDQYPAFESERAKSIFWDRFEHHTRQAKFQPWVVSLMDNHYHVVGYCEAGDSFGRMMQRIHGSVAKLVNDILPERRVPFWRGKNDHDYFDGCLRDEIQYERSYRYTLTQSVRHRICCDWREYRHTRVYVSIDDGLEFAVQNKAFMYGVAYKRYQRRIRKPDVVGDSE